MKSFVRNIFEKIAIKFFEASLRVVLYFCTQNIHMHWTPTYGGYNIPITNKFRLVA
jgi:hypothetical protein